MKQKNQLLHPLFLTCLLLLLLNDFYFKSLWTNGLTGKLSDFAGLIVFPVFSAYLFPGLKKWIALLSGIFFLIWKTPLVSPALDWVNSIIPFRIQRVIDYSDYWALLVLPAAHRLLNRDRPRKFYTGKLVGIGRIGIAGIACFAVCATTVAPKWGVPEGTIYIGKSYKIKKSKQEVIGMIQSLGYNVTPHSNGAQQPLMQDYYQTDNIIIYNDAGKPVDTLLNIKYSLYERDQKFTFIEIINVTIDTKDPIQKWQTLKFLHKQYRKVLERELIRKVK